MSLSPIIWEIMGVDRPDRTYDTQVFFVWFVSQSGAIKALSVPGGLVLQRLQLFLGRS